MRIRILVTCTRLLAFLMVVTLAMKADRIGPIWLATAAVAITCFAVPWLLHHGLKVTTVGLMITFATAFIIGFGAFKTYGLSTPLLVYLAMVPVIGIFFADRRGMIFGSTLAGLVLSLLLWQQNFEPATIREIQNPDGIRFFRTIHLVLVTIFFLGLVAVYDRQRSNLEKSLRDANSKLDLLNQQKNELIGIAAHDLRNPLSAILGFNELMLQGVLGEFSESQRSILEGCHEASKFTLELVNDMLDVSALESGYLTLNREQHDLRSLIRSSLTVLQQIARAKGIELIVDSSADPILAWVDAAKFKQVVHNLVGNAIKYSNAGTSTTVQLGLDGDEVLLTVRDQGQGIPSDELPSVFEPFRRASVRTTGGEKSTGLGLAIVKRIVEGHDGVIVVDSVVGEGTTFTARWPIVHRVS